MGPSLEDGSQGVPEGEGVGADGGEEDGRHVGVHHGAACSDRVGRAAGGRGQHDTIRLDLATHKKMCHSPHQTLPALTPIQAWCVQVPIQLFLWTT